MGSRWKQIAAFGAAVAVGFGAVAATGIALSSEGGRDRASLPEYQQTVAEARNRIDFALGRISEVQSLEKFLEGLDAAASVADETAADLDAAGVADGFGDEHDRLVAALRAFSSELSGTAETIRDPTFTPTLQVFNSLSFKQFVVVNRILRDLREQGIDVEPLTRRAGAAPH